MKKNQNKRILVVLGMHRSGTSAITRGIKSLGVDLGNAFIPTIEGVNDKGFWEDLDINEFNEELLSCLQTTWYELAPINSDDVKILSDKGYLLKAIELLKNKTNKVSIFGFKDPRLAKLLPFWKQVFSYEKFEVSYLIAIRNPLSVARSLSKRDGFGLEYCYLLWYGYTLTALAESSGKSRAIVDYDQFILSPDKELKRIALALKLKISVGELEKFKAEFFDPSLRHNIFSLNDLRIDLNCPSIVKDIYRRLLEVSFGTEELESLEIGHQIEIWSKDLQEYRYSFKVADKLLSEKRLLALSLANSNAQITYRDQGITERDAQIGNLNQGIAERDAQITYRDQGIAERDAQIGNLNQGIAERDAQIGNLNQGIAERDAQITYRDQGITERDAQIGNLNQGIAERDAQITYRDQGIAERDAQIGNLNQGIAERDAQIGNLNQGIAERDAQITYRDQGIAERDAQIGNLNQGIAERDAQITYRDQGIAERDAQIGNLNQGIAQRDAQIGNLNQGIAERDAQIGNLNQGIAERDAQITYRDQGIAERDAQIGNLNQGIAERDAKYEKLINSRSWLITKPVRWVGRLMRGEFHLAFDPFKKFYNSFLGKKNINILVNNAPLETAPIDRTHPVAVIVPVYRDVEMTKRCLLAAMPSVLDSMGTILLAINDDSPSDGMQAMLEDLALKWPNKFKVLKNEKNLGFVKTVNIGLKFASEYDVVLLNSDVVTPKNWLERLIKDAYSRGNVGTVTPFSNNATICSFPYFLQENMLPFKLSVDEVDDVFRLDQLPCIESPTGVGFCMYMRRSCINQIGLLNEDEFGRGYGEENDFCQRALIGGWVNLISPNIFIYHEGGISFSSDKQQLIDKAMSVLQVLHPNYHKDVQKFIEADPIKSARIMRQIQLLSKISVPKVLHVMHAHGGGVEQHVYELAEYLNHSIASVILRPNLNGKGLRVILGFSPHADEILFSLPEDYGLMIECLGTMGINAVHFHHTHNLDNEIFTISEKLGAARILTVHDYYWLSSNPTLTNEHGIFLNDVSPVPINPLYPMPKGISEKEWQEKLRSFIEEADLVIFPSKASSNIYEKIYKIPKSVVAPHIEYGVDIDTPLVQMKKKKIYTIGILGAIGKEKGADFLEEVAILSKRAGNNYDFKVLGYAYRPLKYVSSSGPYDARKLDELISEHKLDVIWFPARWPETYSYTLTYALNSGLPIVAPKLGAFPERLSRRKNTFLFNHLETPQEFLAELNNFINKIFVENSLVIAEKCSCVYVKNFYQFEYFRLIKKNLPNKGKFHWSQSMIVGGSSLEKMRQEARSSWRGSLAYFLWQLSRSDRLRGVSSLIPKIVRKKIRDMLTDQNSDELARVVKGRL